MPYGQKNYSNKVGNGPYSIAQIGCFDTAFCNLLERFGIEVAPDTLNAFFISHNDYLADPADGAGVKDDLSWNSITAYNSGIVVTGQGAGWPSSNNAIVKFQYQSISEPTINGKPNIIDHFCAVADHEAGTIIDSYDGVVKKPGVYGNPVAYATYGGATVQAVSQPVSAAHIAVVTAANVLGNVNVAGLSLSAAMKSDLAAGMSVVAFNAKYSSTPGFQPIATSRQVGPVAAPAPAPAPPPAPAPTPDANVLGNVNVAGLDLSPAMKADLSGGMSVVAFNAKYSGSPGFRPISTARQVGGHGEGVADPSATAAPTSAAYTAFAEPMDLVTNKDASLYNYDTGDVVDTIPAGTPFEALGKAVTTDNKTYFVSDNDKPMGVKTVDLSPSDNPVADEAVAATPPAPAEPTDNADGSSNIPVTVASWQRTFQAFLSPQRYVSNSSIEIEDINDDADGDLNLPQPLEKGTIVQVGGMFDRDGVKYYRTAKSITAGKWYGIPVVALTKPGSDEELEEILGQLKAEDTAAAKTAATPAPAKTSKLGRLFGGKAGS